MNAVILKGDNTFNCKFMCDAEKTGKTGMQFKFFNILKMRGALSTVHS